jgi:uncharacterized membrane protein YfcA
VTHARQGSPNLTLAKWLILGSVPAALVGPWIVHRLAGGSPESVQRLLMECIGFALLFAALTYALRLYVNLRRTRVVRRRPDPDPHIRPMITLAVGALGGLLVGITSVGAGSVIMIALLILYPGLPAVRLVGTDLVQAVPLVLAAATSNIAINGLDWHILIPLVVGSTPGTVLGARLAPRVPQSYIRRGIVVVLTMSGVALLDKSGWAPLGPARTPRTRCWWASWASPWWCWSPSSGVSSGVARGSRCSGHRPWPSSRVRSAPTPGDSSGSASTVPDDQSPVT